MGNAPDLRIAILTGMSNTYLMAMIDPDLDLLRAFLAVADTQNFTRAGERLGRTQSAVSLQIRRLEEAFGTDLFERSPQRVRLTPDGEAALVYVRQILNLKDELVGRLREGEIAGSVRIGAPEDFATRLLPPALARFVRAHPNVALETTCALTLTLLDRFHAGHFDIVLVKRAPAVASLDGKGVWREPLVWVCDTQGAALRSDRIALAVAPEPCVHRKRAVEALNRASTAFRIAYVCESQSGLRAAVAEGLGVSVLPRGAATGLRIVDDDRLPKLADVEIAMMIAEPLSEPALLLAQHLERALSEI
jgi:DNA-binding transcriptional LysR family regulator